MLGYGLSIVARMRQDYSRLENAVSADNDKAIRLLRRWGFTIGTDVTMVGGVPFVQFWSET